MSQNKVTYVELIGPEGEASNCSLYCRLVHSFSLSSKHIFLSLYSHPSRHESSFLSPSHCVPSLFLPVNVCKSRIKITFCRLSEYAVGHIGSYYVASVSYWYAILMQIGSMGVMREGESGIGREERKKARICPLNTMNRHFKFLHTV